MRPAVSVAIDSAVQPRGQIRDWKSDYLWIREKRKCRSTTLEV